MKCCVYIGTGSSVLPSFVHFPFWWQQWSRDGALAALNLSEMAFSCAALLASTMCNTLQDILKSIVILVQCFIVVTSYIALLYSMIFYVQYFMITIVVLFMRSILRRQLKWAVSCLSELSSSTTFHSAAKTEVVLRHVLRIDNILTQLSIMLWLLCDWWPLFLQMANKIVGMIAD